MQVTYRQLDIESISNGSLRRYSDAFFGANFDYTSQMGHVFVPEEKCEVSSTLALSSR